MKKVIVFLAVFFGMIYLFTLCSGGSEPSEEGKALMEQVTEPSAAQAEMVKFGLADGVTIEKMRAVKSPSHGQAWYVGGLITGPNWGKEYFACWIISGTKNDPGIIASVGSFANDYSDYPDAAAMKFEATLHDKGYGALHDVVNN